MSPPRRYCLVNIFFFTSPLLLCFGFCAQIGCSIAETYTGIVGGERIGHSGKYINLESCAFTCLLPGRDPRGCRCDCRAIREGMMGQETGGGEGVGSGSEGNIPAFQYHC